MSFQVLRFVGTCVLALLALASGLSAGPDRSTYAVLLGIFSGGLAAIAVSELRTLLSALAGYPPSAVDERDRCLAIVRETKAAATLPDTALYGLLHTIELRIEGVIYTSEDE